MSDEAPSPERDRGLLGALAAPIDLRIVGRTLLHAALVGLAAGMFATAFYRGLELADELLLERLAGFVPLRAKGERMGSVHAGTFRPWLLVILPALGALASGLLTSKLAPECAGGGGDAAIDAFHHQGGRVRRRVILVKAAASICTLGTGGAGGREGPTLHIGSAIGSLVGRWLRVGTRERRILMVAGMAAGISAIFRTPLGAALLATELLYRDDFESDALVPSLLSSVVAYSVFTSVYGESTLFAHAPRYAFVPAHLPLYALLAVLVALVAAAFVKVLRGVQKRTARLRLPLWAKPALGGLALGLLSLPLLLVVGRALGAPTRGLGILGGGYGAAQLAITGAEWMPEGWRAVQLLLLLAFVKVFAASLTVGTGGSAGDFGPSLALGGLVGGAFGLAAKLLLGDPRIDPGAFALVGMGTFYGGIAHVPLSALVLVCELAGSYDLLVPLMLAGGIAFVALRRTTLYPAQLPTQRDSPAHPAPRLDVLKTIVVRDVLRPGRGFVSFAPGTPAPEIVQRVADASTQDVFPVIDDSGRLVGLITAELVRILAADRDLDRGVLATDAMQPPATVDVDTPLRTAVEAMLANEVNQIPIADATGKVIGMLDEADVDRAYLDATVRWARADAGPVSEGKGPESVVPP